MTALELHHWLRGLHAVPEPSVDRIIVGNPTTVVRGVAVMWMPTWAALREVAAQGLNVVIAHEPTFFSHHDLDGFEETVPADAREIYAQTRDAKRQWLEQQGM